MKPSPGKGGRKLDARTLRSVSRRMYRGAASARRTYDGSGYDDGYIQAVESYALFWGREARSLTRKRP